MSRIKVVERSFKTIEKRRRETDEIEKDNTPDQYAEGKIEERMEEAVRQVPDGFRRLKNTEKIIRERKSQSRSSQEGRMDKAAAEPKLHKLSGIHPGREDGEKTQRSYRGEGKQDKTGKRLERKCSATHTKSVDGNGQAKNYAKQKTQRDAIIKKRLRRTVRTSGGQKVSAAGKGMKKMVRLLSSYGWVLAGTLVLMLLILILSMASISVGTSFGPLVTGNGWYGETLKEAIYSIDEEFLQRQEEIQQEVEHEKVEFIGRKAAWEKVLAVYAVYTTTEVNADEKKGEESHETLRKVFWDMHTITHHVEKIENIVLVIEIECKSVEKLASLYGFTEEQEGMLREFLQEEYQEYFKDLIYRREGIKEDIVSIALSQVGNIGGETYWSWYGFGSHVEWCACFISWCANECGLIEKGVIPKFASCVLGVEWFKEHGAWRGPECQPVPGDILFFDYDGDVLADHTGIVEKCENGCIHTIEGNTGQDRCLRMRYLKTDTVIMGYVQLPHIPTFE